MLTRLNTPTDFIKHTSSIHFEGIAKESDVGSRLQKELSDAKHVATIKTVTLGEPNNQRATPLQKLYPYVIKADVGLKSPPPEKPGAKKGAPPERRQNRPSNCWFDTPAQDCRGDCPQMNNREKRMALGVGALVGLLLLYYVYSSIADQFTQRETKITQLEQTVAKNKQTILAGNVAKKRLTDGNIALSPATRKWPPPSMSTGCWRNSLTTPSWNRLPSSTKEHSPRPPRRTTPTINFHSKSKAVPISR